MPTDVELTIEKLEEMLEIAEDEVERIEMAIEDYWQSVEYEREAE